MTRILTIIALLFATPMLAACVSPQASAVSAAEKAAYNKNRAGMHVFRVICGSSPPQDVASPGWDWFEARKNLISIDEGKYRLCSKKWLKIDDGNYLEYVSMLRASRKQIEEQKRKEQLAKFSKVKKTVRVKPREAASPFDKTRPEVGLSSPLNYENKKNSVKENLVLMPITLPKGLEAHRVTIERSIAHSLGRSYNVFSGAQVQEKLEVEFAKEDCSAESCAQNLAIEFNGELIADVRLDAINDSTAISFEVTNVINGEIENSVFEVCQQCQLINILDFFNSL
jgi:hypothetical protein